MNKLLGPIISVFIFSVLVPAFLQVGAVSAQKIASAAQVKAGLATDNNDLDTEGADDFYNEMVSDDYGSTQSPSFNNREEINPGEAEYGYGYSDGTDNDGGGDSTDPYQSN